MEARKDFCIMVQPQMLFQISIKMVLIEAIAGKTVRIYISQIIINS